ncbi:MAG: TldD/PmbA family protein [Clostridia bacterium]|nr:TldD/PmbA family protein [Clostridia bacterium]MBQ7391024.1 TldD/PmbA family protein [Clostridia bacterium]
MNFDLLKNALVKALLEEGLTEYEIYYMSDESVSVATLNKEVNSFSSSESGGLCLRVLVDGKMGYASTELMSESEMAELPRRAKSNAEATEKPDTVGIYAGSDSYEELKIKKVELLSAADLKDYAIKTGEALFAKDPAVKEGTSSQAICAGTTVRLVNSHGVDLSLDCGINALIGEAVVGVGDENQQDYSFKILTGDETVTEVVDEAVSEALARIGAGSVDSGKYNVVISGNQMRSLLSVFSSAFSAKAVIDGMSRLKGKEGEKIASEIVTITDDPQREGNAVGTTFDAEGVATHRKAVVEAGVLKTFLHNRETALAMGKETTANASKAGYSSPIGIRPYSFAIEPGDKSQDELFAMAGDGIYITEINGLHAGANPVSGDFSLQSAGFLIKDGKKAEAVKGFTVAGNFFELMKSISSLGNKLERGVTTGFTGFCSPDVLVPGMSIAGK